MEDLIIVGAGGFGRELLQWVKDINKVEKKWNIIGFIDDNKEALNAYECDYSVVGTIQEWMPQKGQNFAMAIADVDIKEKVSKQLKEKGAEFATIIHPTAIVGEFNELGEGLVVFPNVRIAVNIKIGDFVTILDNTCIGHDVEIMNYCTLSGGCNITRSVKLKEKVFLGCGVNIVPQRTIGEHAFVCAGSTVMKSVGDGIKVMGNPARKVAF